MTDEIFALIVGLTPLAAFGISAMLGWAPRPLRVGMLALDALFLSLIAPVLFQGGWTNEPQLIALVMILALHACAALFSRPGWMLWVTFAIQALAALGLAWLGLFFEMTRMF